MKILILISFIFINIFNANEISNYEIVNKSIEYKNNIYTILRSFTKDEKKYFLVVNENTLLTSLIEQNLLLKYKKNNDLTKYKKLLKSYSKKPFNLENYGLKSIETNNIYLTVDMCPSSKEGYEKEFFKSLIIKKESFPIVIFISGKWIKKHNKDFMELINYQRENKLNIIWGNHTFNHFYNRFEKLEKNFLLAANSDVIKEVLDLEKLLLSYDLLPSILFRFPGLISDEKTIKTINSLGLIPVGSSSWLAKNEKIKNGNIILVHGNKNEPKGIDMAQNILKDSNLSFGNLLDDL